MTVKTPRGVFAAALTPLKADGSLDFENVLPYLDFLARRGCHGALLFGTTGEGPSFTPEQRLALGKVAVEITRTHPDFFLMMGTGTPSLDETIQISRGAFDLGMRGVVVLPPYFNRKASDDGLFAWFDTVLRRAVPEDGFLLGYHIPQMTGMHLSLDLLDRLLTAYPERFVGIKNSWTEASFAAAVGERFGADMVVMSGFDNHFQYSLERHASGCITASATLASPLLRRVWDLYQQGEDPSQAQAAVDHVREVMDRCPPAPPLLKGLLARWHGFPRWNVCPPLVPLGDDMLEKIEPELAVINPRAKGATGL